MNMYERFAICDIWFGFNNGNVYVLLLVNIRNGKSKLIETGEMCSKDDLGRPMHISNTIAETLKPNELYVSKILQDSFKLMEQARWDKDTFCRLWSITYTNGITTREEMLHMTDEIRKQDKKYENMRKAATKTSIEYKLDM